MLFNAAIRHVTSFSARCFARSFIGFICGIFSYSLNYPSIMDAQSPHPKARKWTTLGLTGVAQAAAAQQGSAFPEGEWHKMPADAEEGSRP